MNIIKTPSIALRDYELSEQDKIVLFYTKKAGLIKVVVKGARKIKSRFAAAVQFPSYIDIFVYRKNSLKIGTLTDCRRRFLFPKIKRDIFRFAYASHLAEVLLSSIKEDEANEDLFYLLLKAFFLLEEKKEDFGMLASSFKLKLLYILGYAPELKRCIECGKKRDSFKSFYFNPKKGGIMCQSCQKKDMQVIGVPKLTVLAMDYLMKNRIGQSLKLHKLPIEKQINYLLDTYFLYHVNSEQKNKSQSLIQQLKKLR